jgi:hypothetical protein
LEVPVITSQQDIHLLSRYLEKQEVFKVFREYKVLVVLLVQMVLKDLKVLKDLLVHLLVKVFKDP